MQAQISKKTSGQDLTSFQTILEFITNLQDYYGADKHPAVRPLNLYHRLISKMSFRDDELILRHINVFKNFCVSNREQIRTRNSELNVKKIEFSDRIYIDMGYILNKSDADSTNAVWEYLLTISAYVDPENKTKELLQQLRENTNSNEGNFLANMIETMSTQLPGAGAGAGAGGGGDGNPLALIGNLMNSDLIGNLMGSMNSNLENGNLDLGKLMGTMSGLINNVKSEIEKSDDPTIKQLSSLLNLPIPQTQQNSSEETQQSTTDADTTKEETAS
jgi:hypothetical protein